VRPLSGEREALTRPIAADRRQGSCQGRVRAAARLAGGQPWRAAERTLWERQRAIPFDFGICCLEDSGVGPGGEPNV
jgi:hypothetical protein